MGDEFLRYFIDYGHLKPGGRVLDVGSGDGRMARALTSYLDPSGSYEGLEIVRSGVEWCQGAITTKYPRFRFQHADIFNQVYNADGKIPASRYQFPFDAAEFDFVFLTSVFTHMLAEDYRHYLDEISRVLKPGGWCFASMFLVTREAQAGITSGRSNPRFRFRLGGLWVDDLKLPEKAVAYLEADVLSDFEDRGLSPEPIRYGYWCGRSDFVSCQDLVAATKAA
ncbi:MAG TPA: class I SAM-dependent methyltransferase [Candidatus Dormibacteraeota bacterium]|nr:class I SAM-dependent methyltransferase [Candidatus Dormibacteraeota bacterium]